MTNVYLSWINGMSAFMIVIVTIFFFFRDIYRYKKHEISIYINGMILYLTIVIGWMGITLSFISVITLGYNPSWVKEIMIYFAYCSLPIGSYVITSSAWDVTGSPMDKKIVLIISIVISACYYILLFTSLEHSIHVSELESLNEVYDDWVNPLSFFYVFFWAQTMISTIISAIGWNKFRRFSSGKLKKRSIFIVVATPIFGFVVLADTVIPGDFVHSFIFIPRLLLIVGMVLVGKGFEPNS